MRMIGFPNFIKLGHMLINNLEILPLILQKLLFQPGLFRDLLPVMRRRPATSLHDFRLFLLLLLFLLLFPLLPLNLHPPLLHLRRALQYRRPQYTLTRRLNILTLPLHPRLLQITGKLNLLRIIPPKLLLQPHHLLPRHLKVTPPQQRHPPVMYHQQIDLIRHYDFIHAFVEGDLV